jgi:hypothetical protein
MIVIKCGFSKGDMTSVHVTEFFHDDISEND